MIEIFELIINFIGSIIIPIVLYKLVKNEISKKVEKQLTKQKKEIKLIWLYMLLDGFDKNSKDEWEKQQIKKINIEISKLQIEIENS